MDYSKRPNYHFKPQKGWLNDPNGLVWFKGYYHLFFQHAPDYETPWHQHMHWGHARTKDFLNWEELPVALCPDTAYDGDGCWSGTAIVREGVLYLFYASITRETREQTVSVACSTDGVNFEKYSGNPVIACYPPDGGPDFRDPAVCCVNGEYCCVMASGNPETKTARLLLYKSRDLLNWEYSGIMSQWENGRYSECPSLVPFGDKYLLTASVCPLDAKHYFTVMIGHFEDGRFVVEDSAEVDKGPDQYAGQVFSDHLGRALMVTWIPGWDYIKGFDKCVGCMSVPRELTVKNGKICGYPVEEVRHLLKDSDEAVELTEKGFVIQRTNRSPVVYEGEIRDLKIIRDEHFIEVFVNGGEEIFSALL